MNFSALEYPYPSRRSVVFAKNGMVATSQTLAAQAGLQILRQGGNAVDAAVATAACLTVVEPTSNGIGGDAFALVWLKEKLYGLNSSGPAPTALTPELLEQHGLRQMPLDGWLPVTVPGAPAAWAELVGRFGRLKLTEVLAPAIEYAEAGFPVSPIISRQWAAGYKRFGVLKGPEFGCWLETFAPAGRAPLAGEIWRSPAHAHTLRRLADSDCQDFYQGEIARRIDAFSRQYGGCLRASDLAGYRPEWVEPISVNYRGHEVWELPPNGHGLVTLLALNILQGMQFERKESADTYHLHIEAIKLAFADGLKYIADPRRSNVPVKELLAEAYTASRRGLIGPKALQPTAGEPVKGGTVYLATADGEGNMVSYIQSNYMGFGSGLVVPETGIALHNRGCNFSLEPGHANALAPGKRPYHTIIPGFLTKDGKAVGPFGVMGGFVQPQGHLQMVTSMLDFGLNPQAALDAPRWQWLKDKTVELEAGFPTEIAEELAARGHNIQWASENLHLGRGQIILRDETGVLAGGTEPRTDGAVAAW